MKSGSKKVAMVAAEDDDVEAEAEEDNEAEEILPKRAAYPFKSKQAAEGSQPAEESKEALKLDLKQSSGAGEADQLSDGGSDNEEVAAGEQEGADVD